MLSGSAVGDIVPLVAWCCCSKMHCCGRATTSAKTRYRGRPPRIAAPCALPQQSRHPQFRVYRRQENASKDFHTVRSMTVEVRLPQPSWREAVRIPRGVPSTASALHLSSSLPSVSLLAGPQSSLRYTTNGECAVAGFALWTRFTTN